MHSQITTLSIADMSCAHCVAAVEQALAGVPGIATVAVGVGSAAVRFDDAAAPREQTLAAAIQAIREAGYAVAAAPAGGAVLPGSVTLRRPSDGVDSPAAAAR